jgi:predicted small metal-binding protein
VVALDKLVECGCGWSCRGTEDQVVDACTEHGRTEHQMDLSRDQVLAAAKPVDE